MSSTKVANSFLLEFTADSIWLGAIRLTDSTLFSLLLEQGVSPKELIDFAVLHKLAGGIIYLARQGFMFEENEENFWYPSHSETEDLLLYLKENPESPLLSPQFPLNGAIRNLYADNLLAPRSFSGVTVYENRHDKITYHEPFENSLAVVDISLQKNIGQSFFYFSEIKWVDEWIKSLDSKELIHCMVIGCYDPEDIVTLEVTSLEIIEMRDILKRMSKPASFSDLPPCFHNYTPYSDGHIVSGIILYRDGEVEWIHLLSFLGDGFNQEESIFKKEGNNYRHVFKSHMLTSQSSYEPPRYWKIPNEIISGQQVSELLEKLHEPETYEY